MGNIANLFRRIDWVLFLSAVVLSGLGLLAIWSVDLAQDPGDFSNFKKQLVFVVAGALLTLVFAFLDYRALRSMSRLLYILGALLLIAVLFFGITVRGTRGWFGIGSFTFQPVELVKVILILILAKYLSERAHIIDMKVVLNLGLLTGLYVGLTMLQPDFGSALVLLIVSSGMFILTNVPRRYIVAGILIAALAFTLGWVFLFKDYQKARLISFLNPQSDPFGRGYNIRQSVIAVGAGGIFGRGLGEGSQSQLRFLPEAQTDFIFAVLAEQLGFVVVLLILAAYGVLLWRLVFIAKRITDGFALFCISGFFIVVALQMFLNIGMNIGILPIVGLPLPFVSLGGSALLSNFLLLGIIQSIHIRG